MKEKGKNKGITLIALVVTIVILLILAAITINLILNDDGIIKKAQEAGEKYKEAAKSEEEKLKELAESFTGQSSKKIAIKIVSEDNPNKPLFDCALGVYTDSECQQFLKEIKIDGSLPVSNGYSYESDDILEEGTYYIKMTSAVLGYNINTQVFQFEVTTGRNVLTITVRKLHSLSSTGEEGTIEYIREGTPVAYDEGSVDITLQVEYEGPRDPNMPLQVLLEPVAAFNGIKYGIYRKI